MVWYEIGASRGSRFAAGLPAILHLQKNDYECVAYNLSRSGTLVVGRFPGLAGYRVEVTFRQPQGEMSVRLAGRVVRAEHEEGDDHLALEFMELDEEKQDALEILLARVIEGHSPAPIETLRPGAPVHEVRRALEQVPLPHRISLATRATPREREFLCQDMHPQVLEALVRNPNLRLPEARSLATVPLRWANDEEVNFAIVAHPRTPLVLARKIVDKLKPPVLKKLIQMPGVPPSIRTELQRRRTRR